MGAARSIKTLLDVNQKDGFDCPGCAWPDPDGERSAFRILRERREGRRRGSDDERVTPDFFREWSVAELSRKSDYWLGKQGRLTQPMMLRRGATHYEPSAGTRRSRRSRRTECARFAGRGGLLHVGPHAATRPRSSTSSSSASSAPTTCPTARTCATSRAARGARRDDRRRQGHRHARRLRPGRRDLHHRPEPGHEPPAHADAPCNAPNARGCKIVAVNPLPETGLDRFKHPQDAARTCSGRGTQLADLFLQVRINGDVPLLEGHHEGVLEEEARRPARCSTQLYREHTDGFEEFADALERRAGTRSSKHSGVAREQMREAARIFIESNARSSSAGRWG